MMKLSLSSKELDVLIHTFDDLLNEILNQKDLYEQNNDEEELLEICEFLAHLYWKMLRYFEFVR